MHCVGTDSRCAGKEKEESSDLEKSGVHCRWLHQIPERTGECVGNDSRCEGAPRSSCEELALNTACRWKRACKDWCKSRFTDVPWLLKCEWEKCAGCHQCESRRLQEDEL